LLTAHRAIAAPADASFPLRLIEEVVDRAGARERRRRLLPAAAVMVFVLGCCLFSADSYGEVARKLACWLGPLAGRPAWHVPGSAALARARRRLGSDPFELLFTRLAGPLAGPGTPGAAAFGRVLVAIDGTSLEVPYTPANIAAFGAPPSGRAAGCGFPRVELVTVTGCGTRGLAGAAFGPRRGAGCSEQELARQLTGVLGPQMLVLADRGFCGYPVVSALAATGAQVIIRVGAHQQLPIAQALTDGSYLSVLPEPKAKRTLVERNSKRRRRGAAADTSPLPGSPVRVIMFSLTVTGAGGSRRSEPYRLITTLLDPAEAPAAEVAACYAQRWEAETGYRELKVTLRGPGRVLRSKDPAMVKQEIWAMLCACQLIQAQRAAAAATAKSALDPDRISFTITLRAIRRQATSGHHGPLTSEILGQLLPPRRPRSFPRLPLNPTASRRNARAGHSGPITCTITINPASTGLPGP
jgi:hypothetical protein